MNMTSMVHLMGNVVQQSEAPGLHVSPCSTLEAKLVHQSEAPVYTPFTLGHGSHVSGHRCRTSAKRD